MSASATCGRPGSTEVQARVPRLELDHERDQPRWSSGGICECCAHLDEGGYFVVEVAVHKQDRTRREISGSLRYGRRPVGIDTFDDPSTTDSSHHWTEINGHLHRDTGRFRYVWPSELDLMARLASMRLVIAGRMAGRGLHAESESQVAVYRNKQRDYSQWCRRCRSPDVTVPARCLATWTTSRAVSLLRRYHELGSPARPKTGQGVNVRERPRSSDRLVSAVSEESRGGI